MLNKPKFMKPSTNKEECTIDLNAEEIPFSCIVDGNESITKWQIKIYDITNDEEVFKTEEVTLEPSFYPVDEKNRNVEFLVNLYKHIPKGNTTLVNRPEAYYWTITLWGKSGYSTTSYQEVFYANATPEIGFSYIYQTGEGGTLNSEGNVLTSKSCTFKATCEEIDGVQLKRYGWRIKDTDSKQVLVDTITKNQIYGSSDNIICKYDGFLNGGNYSVELFIETQNNAKITTDPIHFSVSYSSTFLSNDFKVETLKNEPAIMLDWTEAVVISGILNDAENNVVSISDTTFKKEYPVKSHCSIEIPDKFKVVYDYGASTGLDIDKDSYISLSTQLLSRKNEVDILFFAEGYDDIEHELKRQLSYSNSEGVFRYDVVGKDGVSKYATHNAINKPSEYVWYNIFMSPMIETGDGDYIVRLNIFESRVINCIYPSISLYPMAKTAWTEVGSEDFYPILGNWLREE